MNTRCLFQFVVVTLVNTQSLSRDDERLAKSPESIDAAYVVPAYMKSYFLDVQAIEPRWLYSKQIEKWFPIESHASYVATAIDTPTQVPKELREQFSKLAATSDEAEKSIMNGPMMGPQRAYIVFDTEKRPTLIVYLQFGTLVTHHAHEVAGNDTFQAFEGWTSYNDLPDLARYLQSLGPEKEVFETPFLKWTNEMKSETKKPSK